MNRRQHHWRRAVTGVSAALAVTFGSLALSAPATADPGDETEIELADGLLDYRLYDLAELIYKRAIAAGGSTKKAGELGLVKLLKVKARNEIDPEKQKSLFDEAIKKFQELLKGGGGDVDAKFQLADLLTEKGTSLIDQMERADSDEQRESLRKDAQDTFTQVHDLFSEVVKDYFPKYEKAKNFDTGDVDPKKFAKSKVNDLIKGWLLQGEALYHRGRINTDKRARDQDLKKAVGILEEFIWEFESLIVGFWAYITQGQCYTALGKYSNAAEVFEAVLNLDAADEATMDVRLVAYWRYAESLNEAAQHDGCIQLLARAEKEYLTKLLDKPAGQAAILEKGKAYAGLQQIPAAINEAMKVVSANMPFKKATALKLLAGWAALDPSVGADIAYLQGVGLKSQAARFNKEDLWYEAIAAFQGAAQALSTPEEQAKYGVKIWKQIGDCYFNGLDLYYESGLAYTQGAQLEAGTEAERGECAYWAYRSYQERYKQTKPDTFDRNLYHESRSYFSSTFPSHPKMGNIPFYEARDKEDEEKFLDAATAYERLDPDSEKYEIALARAGGCYYKEFDKRRKKTGKVNPSDNKLLTEAAKKLDDFLKRTEAEVADMDEKKKASRLNARGLSVFYLARIAEAQEDLPKLLTILDGFKDKFGTGQKGLVSSVLMLELQALGKLKKVDEAAAKLEELRGFNKNYYLLGVAQQLVASLFDDMAVSLEEKGELGEAADYRRRAAAFFHGWIQGDEDAQKDKNNVMGVAFRCAKVAEAEDKAGRLPEAMDFYDKSASLFSILRTSAKKFGLTPKEATGVDHKLADCRVRYAEILEAAGREDDAAGAWKDVLGLLKELYDKAKSKSTIERLATAYERAGKYNEALELFAVLVKGNKPYSENWWDAKYWICEIQYREHLALKKKGKDKAATKKLSLVKGLLENLRLVTPTLGGTEMAKQFANLATRCGLKEGWDQYK